MKIIITEAQLNKVKDFIKGGVSDNQNIETIAKKHNVTVDHIKNQLNIGIPTEHEHTKDNELAKEIALDHLGENPNYYTKLDKAGLVDEKFDSKAQSRYFYAMANKKGKNQAKWKKLADEFSSKTDYSKIPDKK